jgi:thymidylate synthase (methanogen type)
MEIIKESTTGAWKAAIRLISDEGREVVDHDNRTSKELLNLTITITNPVKDVTEPINLMRELKKWVYPDPEELEGVIFQNESSSVYYYTYGARLFNYADTKNQIDDYIIPLLKQDRNSRRAISLVYHPLSDSVPNIKESPGLISIYFKIVDGKLTASTLLRSNDMFIGWPANIYQVYLLQKYVADRIGVETGMITTISHSAHVFEEYNEEISEILRKE